jgi:hypothetical protein
MKLKLIALFVLCFTVLFTVSCSEEDNEAETKPTNNAPFEAKIGGVQFDSEDSKAKLTFYNFEAPSRPMLKLYASSPDNTHTFTVTLSVEAGKNYTVESWKPGTYNIDSEDTFFDTDIRVTKQTGANYEHWISTVEDVQKGKIVIESNTGSKIKGTFEFDLYESVDGKPDVNKVVEVTEGSFNLTIRKPI